MDDVAHFCHKLKESSLINNWSLLKSLTTYEDREN